MMENLIWVLFVFVSGARMFYNSHDALLRKLEEQADLQQAIEMQGRRLMNLQLLDVKKRNLSSPLPSPSPCPSPSPDQLNHPIFDRSSPEVQPEGTQFSQNPQTQFLN